MNRITRRTAVAAMGVGLSLTGCSGPSPEAGPQSTNHPTTTEVQQGTTAPTTTEVEAPKPPIRITNRKNGLIVMKYPGFATHADNLVKEGYENYAMRLGEFVQVSADCYDQESREVGVAVQNPATGKIKHVGFAALYDNDASGQPILDMPNVVPTGVPDADVSAIKGLSEC